MPGRAAAKRLDPTGTFVDQSAVAAHSDWRSRDFEHDPGKWSPVSEKIMRH
jgi:hypothetical protein